MRFILNKLNRKYFSDTEFSLILKKSLNKMISSNEYFINLTSEDNIPNHIETKEYNILISADLTTVSIYTENEKILNFLEDYEALNWLVDTIDNGCDLSFITKFLPTHGMVGFFPTLNAYLYKKVNMLKTNLASKNINDNILYLLKLDAEGAIEYKNYEVLCYQEYIK